MSEHEEYLTKDLIQDYFESHYDENTLEREYMEILIGQNEMLTGVNEWQANEIKRLNENYQKLKKTYDKVFDDRERMKGTEDQLYSELADVRSPLLDILESVATPEEYGEWLSYTVSDPQMVKELAKLIRDKFITK